VPVLRVGATLKHGTFIISSLLGRGGFGEVYLARQPRMDRDVAIKVLSPSVAEEKDTVQRFEREALAAARLRHPNVLPVFDFDFDEDSEIYFLAMQYIPGGRTLQSLMNVPMPVGEAARIVADVGSALDAAHAEQIIHRDVKPPNVLMDGSRPMLTDFGIAHLSEATGITQHGIAIGTPAYISPEQGQGKPVGPAADQYSLAVMAYHMLAGRPPFTGDSLSLVMQHVSTVPPALNTLNPNLPTEIASVVARALSKLPEQRYPSCSDFASALAGAAGVTLSGRASSPGGQLVDIGSMETVAPLPAGSAGSLNMGQYGGTPTVESAVAPSGFGGSAASGQASRPATVHGDAAAPVSRKPFPIAMAAAAGVAAVVLLVGIGLGVRQMTSSSATTAPPTVGPTLVALAPTVTAAAPVDPQLVPIQLRSNPNAGVFVDDESAGRTPLEVRLKPGEHDLKLLAPSYEEWTKRVVAEPGSALTVPPVDLIPLPAAKVINPTSKSLGKDAFVDASDLVRVATPTDQFRLGEDIDAVVYVSPLTNGIRDLAFDVKWRLERPGGQPASELTARQEVKSAWQQTFMHICIPASAADASGSNAPVNLTLFVEDQAIDTFTFRIGPGPLGAPSQCNREVPAQQAPV